MRSFTLLELLVVVAIVALLAGLALSNYGRSIERSRGGEAMEVLGTIRGMAVAHHHEFGAFNAAGNVFNNAAANIGLGAGSIPDAANPSPAHYFTYGIALGAVPANIVRITATRCAVGSSCKDPSASWGGGTISITTTMPGATDSPTVYNPADAPWR